MNAVTQDSKLASTTFSTRRKHGRWYKSKLHLRRIILEALNLILNYDWLFKLIGFANRKLSVIESVFLVYPATRKYALAYVYPSRLQKVQWDPWLGGLLWQNNKLTIMFVISANDLQFRDPRNLDNLRNVANRMEELRELLQAKQKTFAGILPGLLYLNRIVKETPEADLTATIVSQAVEKVKQLEHLKFDTPIIVLGGNGFIGRRVIKLLSKQQIYSIDISNDQSKDDWPVHLKNQKVLVLNITVNEVLTNYTSVMWPGTVVINEVYPEPSLGTIKELQSNNCECYHIVGVKAMAVPSFPAAYYGAVPCCAAWSSRNIEAVVRKLKA